MNSRSITAILSSGVIFTLTVSAACWRIQISDYMVTGTRPRFQRSFWRRRHWQEDHPYNSAARHCSLVTADHDPVDDIRTLTTLATTYSCRRFLCVPWHCHQHQICGKSFRGRGQEVVPLVRGSCLSELSFKGSVIYLFFHSIRLLAVANLCSRTTCVRAGGNGRSFPSTLPHLTSVVAMDNTRCLIFFLLSCTMVTCNYSILIGNYNHF